MTAATTTNGKPQRKQLSDQLDRLDSILDAIAEGLPGAVTEACREGARQAVKDAIIEIITNPELRALIAPAQSAPNIATPVPASAPAKPNLWNRLKAKLSAAREAIAGVATKAREMVTTRCKAATEAVVAVGRATGDPAEILTSEPRWGDRNGVPDRRHTDRALDVLSHFHPIRNWFARGVVMAKSVTIDELHATFRIPNDLSDHRAEAIRQTLVGDDFMARLRKSDP